MRHFVAVFLVTTLAGCLATPKLPPAEPEPVKQSVAPKPAKAAHRKMPVVTVNPQPMPQTAAAPLPKPAINDDPKQLFGLAGHRISDLLGPANFIRRDGPAEVWQYRAKACVLDIYLYKTVGALTVAHIDLRKRRKATLPPRRCFHGLLIAGR